MSKEIRPSSIIISAAIFIILEIAALAMLRSSSVLQDVWFNRLSHRTMSILWGGAEKIRNFILLEGQNKALNEEVTRLYAKVQKQEAYFQTPDMNELGLTGKRFNYKFISASIVKMSRNSANNYIILDKGSADGVSPRSAIITTEGVVGLIEAVDKHYSYGLTLMNNKLSLGVKVGEDEVVAPLYWNGISSKGAVIKNVAPHYVINPGDTVRTSGYSSIYPADLPVGITKGSRLINGFTREIDVELFADFSTLHHVIIVRNMDLEEIEQLEKRMEDTEK